MAGFIYNGKSTKDILSSSELILCTFDGIDSVSGHQREDITGEMLRAVYLIQTHGSSYINKKQSERNQVIKFEKNVCKSKKIERRVLLW